MLSQIKVVIRQRAGGERRMSLWWCTSVLWTDPAAADAPRPRRSSASMAISERYAARATTDTISTLRATDAKNVRALEKS